MLARIDTVALASNRNANFAAVGGAALFFTIAGIVAFGVWLGRNPTLAMEACEPGQDGRPESLDRQEDPTQLTGTFLAMDGVRSDLPGYWPQFRGADSTNIYKGPEKLAGSWGDKGPQVLWSVEVGEGFAGPSVLNGCAYLMDYDEEKRADVLRCFSLKDGRELWRRSYAVMIKRNHGMSRTIPALTEKHIVTMGPRCHVVCLDTATGDYRWGIDLQAEYGTEEPLWYTGQCPIIVDNQAIIAPAGPEVFMMAVDCETGSAVWKTPNPHGWNMSHSSIMPMTLLGKKMYIYCALGGIAGVSAEGDDLGTILWERPWDAKVVAPSPVQIGEDHVFMTAGYGKGSMMLRIRQDQGRYDAELLFETKPDQGLACEQQTPIIANGHMYGIMPKDAGALKGQFVCYRPDGTMAWSSGQDNRFGLGPFLLADDKFYILDDDGVLTVLDALKDSYTQLSRMRVLEGHDAWGPMAVAGTRLLLRDMHHLVCIEIGVQEPVNA